MAKKAGRKPGPKRQSDAALARGMRPETGPDGRIANARLAAQQAVEFAALFNQHFTEPDWQVLVALVGTYVAMVDGAQREAATAATGWTELRATRAYLPAKAPDPSQPMIQCILPARMFGKALRDDRVRQSATLHFRSEQHPERTVIGISNGGVDSSPAMGTREMEACAHLLVGSQDCWQNDIPSDAPRHKNGGLTLDGSIATLGRLVGSCPAAEQAAMSFFGYCMARHAAGAPATSPHLRLCAGLSCDTPLFVWSRKAGRKRVGTPAAPNYCPTCLGFGLGDEKSRRAKAHREQRRRRRKNSPRRGA